MKSWAWFPFYFRDYLVDTAHLDLDGHGAYIILISRYANDPDQCRELYKNIPETCKVLGKNGVKNRRIIAKMIDEFFPEIDGLRRNKRLDIEYNKSLDIREKASIKAQTRWEKERMQQHMQQHVPEHMQEDMQSQSQSHTQKNKKKKASSPSAPHPFEQEFEDLWARYPKRIGKPAAAASFKKHIKTQEDLEQFKQALKNYLAHLEPSGSFEYAVHGSTFFNGDSNRVNYKGWKGYITAEVTQKPLSGEERKQLRVTIRNHQDEIDRLNNNIIFFEEQRRIEDLQDARRKVAIKQAIIADLRVQLGEG